MHTITNLMNSPDDLQSTSGLVRLPAMGSVTAEFDPAYLVSLQGIGYYEVSEADPLDHDRDGRKGGSATHEDAPAPVTLSDADEAELIDAMTDGELRDFIFRKTRKRAHPNAKTATLVEKAKEAAKAA